MDSSNIILRYETEFADERVLKDIRSAYEKNRNLDCSFEEKESFMDIKIRSTDCDFIKSKLCFMGRIALTEDMVILKGKFNLKRLEVMLSALWGLLVLYAIVVALYFVLVASSIYALLFAVFLAFLSRVAVKSAIKGIRVRQNALLKQISYAIGCTLYTLYPRDVQCPCCGLYTFAKDKNSDISPDFEFCDVCGWMHDRVAHDYPDRNIGGNHISLNKARENFAKTGYATDRIL